MLNSGMILIVDDEPNLRRSLELLLKRFAYKVHTAVNPFDALESLETSDFDLVLLDLKFPKGDGLELLSELCLRWPETSVLILTAGDPPVMDPRKEKIKFLQKPVEPTILLHSVSELLADKTYPQFQGSNRTFPASGGTA